MLAPLTDVDLASLKYYAIAEGIAWPAVRPTSRAPATPARTASSCSSTGTTRSRCGSAASRPARAAGSCRAAWARATRCGWRRACRCTATSSIATATRTRPAWAASSSSTSRATSSGRAALEQVAEAGPRKPLVGLAVRGRRHRTPRLPEVMAAGSDDADGRRHQRRAVANAGHADRDGIRAAAVGRGRYHGGGRHPRLRGSRQRSSRCRSTSVRAPSPGARPTATS